MEKPNDYSTELSAQRRESSLKKWVLIRPSKDGSKVEFFKAAIIVQSSYGEGNMAETTELLSEAEILEQSEETMQYILDKMQFLDKFSAVPVQDIDIFKAKLAGK
jgi:hypothetical protein